MIVIGGGDTGADCVANAHRENAASVTQIEVLGEPPVSRPDDLTPWPQWPMKLRTSYALKEGGDRDFAISTTHLSGSNGTVEHIHWAQNDGAPPFAPLPGTEESRPAELVLLAMGFLHPEPLLLESWASSATRAATPQLRPSRRRWTECSPPVTPAAVSRSSSGRSTRVASAPSKCTIGSTRRRDEGAYRALSSSVEAHWCYRRE